MMRRMSVPLVPLWIGLILVAALLGLMIGRSGTNRLQDQIRSLNQQKLELQEQVKQETAVLFFLKSNPTNFRLVPVTVKVDSLSPEVVLERLLAGPRAGMNFEPIFPQGSKVLGVTVKQGLATVDLNQTTTRLNVGSEGESLAIASIVNTLTKLPQVYRVKIMVEGKEVESLAGHVDLTQTFRFNETAVEWE